MRRHASRTYARQRLDIACDESGKPRPSSAGSDPEFAALVLLLLLLLEVVIVDGASFSVETSQSGVAITSLAVSRVAVTLFLLLLLLLPSGKWRSEIGGSGPAELQGTLDRCGTLEA